MENFTDLIIQEKRQRRMDTVVSQLEIDIEDAAMSDDPKRVLNDLAGQLWYMYKHFKIEANDFDNLMDRMREFNGKLPVISADKKAGEGEEEEFDFSDFTAMDSILS